MTEQPLPRYTNVRDSVTAMREFIIVIAMLSILFAPSRVRGILEDAGIRSLAGVEFDATSVTESEASVKEAHAHINELKQQLALAQQELSKVASSSGTSIDPGLGAISELLARAQRTTIETETNLNHSQEKTRDFLQRHGNGNDRGHRHDLVAAEPTAKRRSTQQTQQATAEQIDPAELFQR
jgi:hypothetical protein